MIQILHIWKQTEQSLGMCHQRWNPGSKGIDGEINSWEKWTIHEHQEHPG